MKNKIIIVGAGGHGKVVYDALVAQQKYSVAGFIDSVVSVGKTITSGVKVIANLDRPENLQDLADFFIVAIGNNEVREKLFATLKLQMTPATVIHPSAVVSPSASIGEGAVILANAVINSSSVIGSNTIVNAAVVVDHDCMIGDHTHLSIGTKVGSNSEIGSGQIIPLGAVIAPFSKIN